MKIPKSEQLRKVEGYYKGLVLNVNQSIKMSC